MTSSEADARIVIDELLRQAQWNPADKSQVRTEVTVQDLEGRGIDTPRPSQGTGILRSLP